MNELERELATLLKQAPGEPLITIDPDTLVPTSRPRRRYLPPLIAAAAVIAIAVPAAVLLNRGPSSQPPSSTRTSPPLPHQPADPHQAAIRTAKTIIAAAPVPPGATTLARPPVRSLDRPGSIPGAQHVQQTRFWTAPGTVAHAIAYLNSHPPQGMHPTGSGSAGGPGVPTTQMLDFQADVFRTLRYDVVAYRGGVAIRADAQVLWAPRRSPADTVPASITSVDVLIARQNPQRHQGAPTVHRTLTGDAARALADDINRLPRAIPTSYVSCPPTLGGEKWYDRLVFHSNGASASVLVDLAGCASTTFTAGHRRPIQLSATYPGVVANINHQILSAIRLPDNYGH